MSDLFWLTDDQMARLEPFFPKSHGKPRVDDRRVLSGIIFINRNGLRWRDAPAVYGPHKTLYNRWKRWSDKGCGATSQLSAGRHRRWMTVTFFDGAGLRPSDQVSMSLLNVAGRELSFAVAISFSGCCLSRSSSMSLSDVAAA